jgi:hypothetical protein
MVEQLWYAMIGTNGEGEIAQNQLMREEFRNFLQHRSETCPVRIERGRRQILPATWIMFGVAIASLVTTWFFFGVKL